MPGVSHEPEATSLVVGDVLELSRPHDRNLLATLDRYLGVGNRSERNHPYGRQQIEVAIGGDRIVPCMCYLLQGLPKTGTLIPHGDWLADEAKGAPGLRKAGES
jgi:gamma-glutamylcyclotransferase (GGCT)/AIG2-like uncharacterized protein YtfP